MGLNIKVVRKELAEESLKSRAEGGSKGAYSLKEGEKQPQMQT